jgi:nucleoside-diphosphate-sugar epimerase
VVSALLRRGYEVRGCVTDPTDPERTGHLQAMTGEDPGRLDLRAANLLADGAYDDIFAGCSAVLHVGTPMGYGGVNRPQQVYDGAIEGTKNVLFSVRKAGTVRRFVYTSSFAAISHPAPLGYRYAEADWASDNRGEDPNWVREAIPKDNDIAYAMAKVASEKLCFETARQDGRFDAITVCPSVVMGPLLSPRHELKGSWQYFLGRMLAGEPCGRRWDALWNIVDVRDVGEAQARIVECRTCGTGDRYQMTATDESGELSAAELQAHLLKLFPEYDIGGPPEGYADIVKTYGGPRDWPRARCDKARHDLGLRTHSVDETLFETVRTLVELGVVKPAMKAPRASQR